MLAPVIPELFATLFKWGFWMKKDWKFRLPFSFFLLAGYLMLCGLLTSEIKRGEDSISRWTLYMAIGLVLIIIYIRSLVNTMEGYAAQMSKAPQADGHCVQDSYQLLFPFFFFLRKIL